MGREHEHDHEDHDQKAHLKVVHEDVPPYYYDTSNARRSRAAQEPVVPVPVVLLNAVGLG